MCFSGKSIASYCDSGGDENGSRDIIDSLVEYYGRHLDESFQRTFRKVALVELSIPINGYDENGRPI